MPSYRDALPEEDRWALSYYVLALSAYKDPLTLRAAGDRGRGSRGAQRSRARSGHAGDRLRSGRRRGRGGGGGTLIGATVVAEGE